VQSLLFGEGAGVMTVGSGGSRRTFRLFRVLSLYLASPIFWCFRSVLHLPTYRALCTQSGPENCKHDFLILSRFPCLCLAALLFFIFSVQNSFNLFLGLTPARLCECLMVNWYWTGCYGIPTFFVTVEQVVVRGQLPRPGEVGPLPENRFVVCQSTSCAASDPRNSNEVKHLCRELQSSCPRSVHTTPHPLF